MEVMWRGVMTYNSTELNLFQILKQQQECPLTSTFCSYLPAPSCVLLPSVNRIISKLTSTVMFPRERLHVRGPRHHQRQAVLLRPRGQHRPQPQDRRPLLLRAALARRDTTGEQLQCGPHSWISNLLFLEVCEWKLGHVWSHCLQDWDTHQDVGGVQWEVFQ